MKVVSASTSNKESLLKLDLSLVILCLIKLLYYEGSISNPFQLRGNIDAGLVVYESCYSCLVAETKKQSSGKGGCTVRTEYNVNALCILAIRCLQMLSKRSCDFHVIFCHSYMNYVP